MPAVVGVQRTPGRRLPPEVITAAVFRDDWGIEGDRHARPRSSRQIVLVEAEVLRELGLPAGATREQLTVDGFAGTLAAGDVLRAGASALIELVRARVPCAVMDGIRPGLERQLRRRGGWCGRVRAGGVVRVGDPIAVDTTVGDPAWLADYLLAVTEWEESGPGQRRVAAVSAEDERVATLLDPAAADRLRAETRATDFWSRHDDWSTSVIDAARVAAPSSASVAEPLLRGLAAHYRSS